MLINLRSECDLQHSWLTNIREERQQEIGKPLLSKRILSKNFYQTEHLNSHAPFLQSWFREKAEMNLEPLPLVPFITKLLPLPKLMEHMGNMF